MSLRCAENCGLTRLIDRRFQGLLKYGFSVVSPATAEYKRMFYPLRGVGTSVMVGRIHVAQLKIGNSFFAASLTILEHDKMDFLFGLDLLRYNNLALFIDLFLLLDRAHHVFFRLFCASLVWSNNPCRNCFIFRRAL